MESLVRHLHCKAGVSLPYNDLSHSWYHFRQACCAFEEGYALCSTDHLYFFQEYVGRYMLHHALGEFPQNYLLDIGMQKILKHDELYSVSYMETLKAYFESGMNMSQTAENLGIHRTSLNSRMQKIKEYLNHELTPEYVLYLQMILAIVDLHK